MTPTTETPRTYYRFYVTTVYEHNGETYKQETEWRRLTKTKALQMYRYTDAHQPCNVVGYGWEECK